MKDSSPVLTLSQFICIQLQLCVIFLPATAQPAIAYRQQNITNW